MRQVAATLTKALQKKVVSIELTPEQALERGMHAGWVRSQEWSNEVGYRADIDALRTCGIALTSFAQWSQRRRNEIIVE